MDDKFESFNKYRNSQLQLECDEGDFGLLEVSKQSKKQVRLDKEK